jgi:hypothetical protein
MKTVQIVNEDNLQQENVELRRTVVEQNHKIIYLEEQLAWLKRQIFGKRSKKSSPT